MRDGGNRQIRNVKTITSALAFEEWVALRQLARQANLSVGQYVRAIVKDAIYDEGIDVRQQRPQECPESREGSPRSGEAAS